MTKDDYLASSDPRLRLRWFLDGEFSDRKVRLVAVAFCRNVWELLTDERSRAAVEVAERFADGETTISELEEALIAAGNVIRYDSEGYLVSYGPTIPAAFAAQEVADENAFFAAKAAADNLYHVGPAAYPTAGNVYHETPYTAAELENIRRWMMDVLHDIFGNPFGPVPINPAWLTPTVLSLAQAVYDNRNLPAGTMDNPRLAVLADALEYAGCDNADILNHCRQRGEHVRGCWVVDLLIGKC